MSAPCLRMGLVRGSFSALGPFTKFFSDVLQRSSEAGLGFEVVRKHYFDFERVVVELRGLRIIGRDICRSRPLASLDFV